MMRVHRLLRAGLVTLCVLGGGLALCSPVALAGEGLGITATFGAAGSGNGQFKEPDGVAVNQTSGDVYVVDRGNNRVERFSAAGSYEAQFNGTEIDGVPAGAGHEAPAKFSEPSGIATDPTNGDVYVIDSGHNVIDKFSAAGSYISQLSGFSDRLAAVAVDGSGNLWVYLEHQVGYTCGSYRGTNPKTEGALTEFSETGTVVTPQFYTNRCATPVMGHDSLDGVYVGAGGGSLVKWVGGTEVGFVGFLGTESDGLTFDLATNDLYVDGETSIAQYAPFGEPFGEPPLYVSGVRSSMVAGSGIAVNSTSHDVYVADSSKNLVDVFALGPFPNNEPKTEAGEVKGPVVTLKGELRGGELGYYFTYNDNGSCEGAGQTPEGDATGTTKVSATIDGGLEANTLYTFCIVATDAYGQEPGLPPSTFKTEPVPPLVKEASTPYVGVFEATIDAKVNPENDETTCLVQYGKTTAYEEAPVPCEQASFNGHVEQPASASLENLNPSTTYYYRVVAENVNHQTSGLSEGTGHFTTAVAHVPAIEAESVSVESGSGATREVTFAAQVNPNLEETTSCGFEYAKSGEAYGLPVPCEPSETFGKGSKTTEDVHAKVNGLVAGADYHYRVVVKDKTGPSDGKDQVFGPPAVVTGAVLSKVPGVAPSTTAPVGGEVNPEELDTRYYVQYGETGAYGQIAPYLPSGVKSPQGIDAGSGSKPVVLGSSSGITCGLPCQAPPDISLESLTPGATYHYRLVAYNADGTTYGADETVKVLPAPQVGPASVSEVTQESATITTSVNPEGLHTLYNLDVGTSTAYGTPHRGDAGSGSTPVALTFKLSGLHAGDTYHFRLVASSSNGTSGEADQTFETAAKPPEVPFEPIKPPLELGLVSVPSIPFPTEPKPTTTKALTKAQKLAKALKACKKKHPKSKRAACIKQARKQYAPAKKAKK